MKPGKLLICTEKTAYHGKSTISIDVGEAVMYLEHIRDITINLYDTKFQQTLIQVLYKDQIIPIVQECFELYLPAQVLNE
jgi:hypothetical protein